MCLGWSLSVCGCWGFGVGRDKVCGCDGSGGVVGWWLRCWVESWLGVLWRWWVLGVRCRDFGWRFCGFWEV